MGYFHIKIVYIDIRFDMWIELFHIISYFDSKIIRFLQELFPFNTFLTGVISL